MVCSYKTKVMILSLLMILVLLTTWTAAPLSYSHAVLAELTVTGEVVMTLATLASLMMIAFGASGMDGAVRNQAAATGTQPLTYVGQLLNRWLSSGVSNLGFSTLATKMQEGLSYLPDGTLYLDSEATAAVADFQRWAWEEDGAGLKNYDVGTIDESVANVNGVSLATSVTGLPSGTFSGRTYYAASELRLATLNEDDGGRTIAAASSEAVRLFACILSSDSHVYLTSSTNQVYVRATAILRSGALANATYGGTGYINQSWFRTSLQISDGAGTYLPVVQTLPNWSDLANAQIGSSLTVGDADTFYGPMQQGQGAKLPLSGSVTVSADAAARLHLDNYLRAVAAAYAGTGTASVPVTDVGTGDEDTLPLSVPLDTPIGVTGVSDAAIDQSGSVAGSDAVASDFEGLDDYTMDLTQFFPFCVPFDLAYLFEKLRADPQALVIDWHFMIPYLDVDIPIQIDLSPFDSVAQLLRSLEVIAFIVALLVGTKNLIQGGD